MKSLILLLGVCCIHWTAAIESNHGDLLLDLDDAGVLHGVIPTTDSDNINLSGLGIVYVAEDALVNLTNVRTLDLSNNKLRRAPRLSKYPHLHDLEELSLANNQLTLLGGTFTRLGNLKLVDVSKNLLKSIMEEEFFGLPNSTEVVIEGNPIRWISPRAFDEPPHHSVMRVKRAVPILPLEQRLNRPMPRERFPKSFAVAKICLNDGIVMEVEESQENEILGNCSKAALNRMFRVLDFSKKEIENFQIGWYKLPADLINKIDFSNNRISEITPELLNDLPSGVSSVRVNHNSIQIIKKDVIVNEYLEALFLDYNNISTIESGAFEKTNLTILSVVHNNLKDLAFVPTLSPNFKAIDLSYNGIEEIPVDTFRNLKELKIIKLMNNRVERIESGTFLDQKNLEILDFAGNAISELNSGQFEGLTKVSIDLVKNRIRRIPEGVFSEIGGGNKISAYFSGNTIDIIEKGSFSNLEINTLELSHTQMTDDSIEEGAFENSTIYNLHLDRNFITEIKPEWFKGISKMENLDLSKNRINIVRRGAAKYMGDLEMLGLSENPIEIFESGALYGLSKEKDVFVHIVEVPIKVIRGDMFNDVLDSENDIDL